MFGALYVTSSDDSKTRLHYNCESRISTSFFKYQIAHMRNRVFILHSMSIRSVTNDKGYRYDYTCNLCNIFWLFHQSSTQIQKDQFLYRVPTIACINNNY